MSPRSACSRLATVEQFNSADCDCGCALTADQIEGYLDDASDLVYELTGHTWYGECEGTVRPVRCCYCGCCFGCGHVDVIPLHGPIISIDAVQIDGTVLVEDTDFRIVRDGIARMSTTGVAPPRWPNNQELWRPDGEENTFSITYTFGQEAPFPAYVWQATVELACDMAKHFGAVKRGALPANTSAATYANVSVTARQSAEVIQANIDSFPAVRRLVGLANPRQQGASGFYTPQASSAWSFPLS